MNFIRRLEEIFVFQATYLKFGQLLVGWTLVINAKFQHNISKITPARTKQNRYMVCEYYNIYFNFIVCKVVNFALYLLILQ